MNVIPTFDPNSLDVLALVDIIQQAHPVAHLRDEEIKQTLRLIQLEQALKDEKRTSRFAVTVYQDDKRLEGLSDDDKFLALLLDADCRNTILMSKRCRYCFGGTIHTWRKAAGRCELIEARSATVAGDYGGQYLGRGWVITPYIKTLKNWIIENSLVLTL